MYRIVFLFMLMCVIIGGCDGSNLIKDSDGGDDVSGYHNCGWDNKLNCMSSRKIGMSCAVEYGDSVYWFLSYEKDNTDKTSLVDLIQLTRGDDGYLDDPKLTQRASAGNNYKDPCQPTACVYNGKIYYFYVDSSDDPHIYYRTYDGSNPGEEQTLDVWANRNFLASVIFNGELFLFYSGTEGEGTNNELWYISMKENEEWGLPKKAVSFDTDQITGLTAAIYMVPDDKEHGGRIVIAIALGSTVRTYITKNPDAGFDTVQVQDFVTEGGLNVSAATMQNGTVTQGVTNDAMQLWLQVWKGEMCQWYHYELDLTGDSLSWDWKCELDLPHWTGASIGNGYALCSIPLGLRGEGNKVQMKINLLGYQYTDYFRLMQAYYDSDYLVPEESHEFYTQDLAYYSNWSPFLVIEGMCPFSYNGNDYHSTEDIALLEIKSDETKKFENSFSYTASVTVGTGGSLFNIFEWGMSFSYAFSKDKDYERSLTVKNTSDFKMPNFNKKLDDSYNNGEWGWIMYAAPALVNRQYTRYAADHTTDLKCDVNFVYATGLNIGTFSYNLADPSKTRPVGYEVLTEGMQGGRSPSSDLESWMEVHFNPEDLLKTLLPISVNDEGPQETKALEWDESVSTATTNTFSCEVDEKIASIFKMTEGASFSYTNKQEQTTSKLCSYSLQLPTGPEGASSTYSGYTVTPFLLTPNSDDPYWVPTQFVGKSPLYCLTWQTTGIEYNAQQ